MAGGNSDIGDDHKRPVNSKTEAPVENTYKREVTHPFPQQPHSFSSLHQDSGFPIAKQLLDPSSSRTTPPLSVASSPCSRGTLSRSALWISAPSLVVRYFRKILRSAAASLSTLAWALKPIRLQRERQTRLDRVYYCRVRRQGTFAHLCLYLPHRQYAG
jgi:hypothetical protein